MAIPSYQAVMQPLMELLQDGQPKPIKLLHDLLCEHFDLSEEEIRRKLNSGKSTYMRSRVGWARTYLHKAGLLSLPSRGHCQITDRGHAALAESTAPIDNRYLKQFPEFLDFVSPKKSSSESENELDDTDPETPEEQIQSAYDTLQKALAQDLLNTIKEGSPAFFEQLVVDLMIAMGYGGSRKEAGQATSYTADGGVDGVIKDDPLSLDTIYLQAKRYSEGAVSRPDVQKFAGALDMQRAKKGVFITTSRFTAEALDYVKMIEKKIILIDGERLSEMMIEHGLGVSTKQSYDIKQLDMDYFIEN